MTVTMLGLAVATRALLRRLGSPSMPTRRNLEAHPNQYLAPGGTWPDGPLRKPVKPEAEFVMEIARRLRDACEKSVKALRCQASRHRHTDRNKHPQRRHLVRCAHYLPA